ncbi:hypothetical protein A4U64_26765 (plasmid) [Rhodococcus sp. WB1]|nr:hypothetical protein A4U64_26765 [Rhodococcus sp. WB1]
MSSAETWLRQIPHVQPGERQAVARLVDVRRSVTANVAPSVCRPRICDRLRMADTKAVER